LTPAKYPERKQQEKAYVVLGPAIGKEVIESRVADDRLHWIREQLYSLGIGAVKSHLNP